MSCGGRVYKGDTIIISVPFDVENYENLVITYTTTGDAKVVKTEDEVTIEDGFITYVSDGGELDLLPDGVIYYSIYYEVDGVDHVESTNTPLYLKTPAGYSGKTADDIYQDGYEAGLNDCSGTSCMLYAGEYVLDSQFDGNSGMIYPDAGYNGFNSFLVTDGGYGQAKFESGYTAGQEDCSGNTCNLQDKTVVVTADTQTVTPDQGYDGMGSVSIDANSYGQDMYTSGWTDGYNSGASCNLTEGEFMLSNGWDGDTTLYPDSADGFSSVRIVDNSYGQEKFDSGYTSGEQDGFASGYNSGWTDGYNSGVTTEYGDAIHNAYESGHTAGLEECSGCVTASYAYPLTNDWNGSTIIHPSDAHYGYEFEGFSEVFIYDDGYGQAKYDSGHTAGVESGWSAGWDAGWISGSSSTDCGEAVEEAYGLGYNSGHTDGFNEGFSSGSTYFYNNGYSDGVKQKRVRLSFSFQEMQMTLHGYPRNLIFNGNSQQVYGYGALGADSSSTRTEKFWVDAYTNDASITTVSASCEFHTLTDAFPNSIDLMSVRRGDGVSVSAGTNYITTSFVEQDETGYWYKIDFQVSSSILIKHGYDEGYAEGYAAGLAACQNQ